ncbi:DNA replication licensing factor MCM6 [Camellia lanceoleosa]|uniref:DNA replication licensing factor MCM6 n=1 Tax=Camellia lanceoleosa TaxID=1840588 RepID=A0ACC0FVU3_9ERIC|nr:DNA replication licensing factor MCM6 [Camellia lanceoleosa]
MFIDFSHVMRFNDVLQKAISDEYLRFEPYLKNACKRFVMEQKPTFITDDNPNKDINVAFFYMNENDSKCERSPCFTYRPIVGVAYGEMLNFDMVNSSKEELCSLSLSLCLMYLDYNQFIGRIPDAFYKHAFLKEMYIEGNAFRSGVNPIGIHNVLEVFDRVLVLVKASTYYLLVELFLFVLAKTRVFQFELECSSINRMYIMYTSVLGNSLKF